MKTVSVDVDLYEVLENIDSSDLIEELRLRESEYCKSKYEMTSEFAKRVIWAMEKSEDFTLIEIMDARNLFDI